MPEALFDDPGAAAYLNTTVRHLRELRYKRQIPFVKIGTKSVRYVRADLDAWIEAQTVRPRRAS